MHAEKTEISNFVGDLLKVIWVLHQREGDPMLQNFQFLIHESYSFVSFNSQWWSDTTENSIVDFQAVLGKENHFMCLADLSILKVEDSLF